MVHFIGKWKKTAKDNRYNNNNNRDIGNNEQCIYQKKKDSPLKQHYMQSDKTASTPWRNNDRRHKGKGSEVKNSQWQQHTIRIWVF